MDMRLVKIEVRYEHDIVQARQRARQLAGLLGFDFQDQVRIATAVSELARNAFQYAGGGSVTFSILNTKPQSLQIEVSDRGPGISDLSSVLEGTYKSSTGMGLGIIGVRRLMDGFEIKTSVDQGTQVKIRKNFNTQSMPADANKISEITSSLAVNAPGDPFAEIRQQNRELIAALEETELQRGKLSELNQELEETNRGVVALYAELDQRADYLAKASELKTQFLSNITHEFRTPLNSIRSISSMLLQHLDGELNSEQEKQVNFIKSGAEALSHMVDDLLDLAKVEAGKVTVRPAELDVSDMFGMLRGMLRPLLENNSSIKLIFEEPQDIPTLFTDEEKLSQIMRNFISNSLKYTPLGEVRISVGRHGKNRVKFSVADTGIGIAEKDQMRIFQEFTQVEGQHQQKTKGTGLGLPLSKKLAELLGGFVEVESILGLGSTFSLILPVHYQGPGEDTLDREEKISGDEEYSPIYDTQNILIIDDNETDRYVLKKVLHRFDVGIQEANRGAAGINLARQLQPKCIFLDLNMPELSGFAVLEVLKKDPETADIPVVISTSKPLSPAERGLLESQASLVLAKDEIHKDGTFILLRNVLEGLDIQTVKI